MPALDLSSSDRLTIDGVMGVHIAVTLMGHVPRGYVSKKQERQNQHNCLRDFELLHLLHVLVVKQFAAFETLFDLGERDVLDLLADRTHEALETWAEFCGVDVDALGEGFVEDCVDEAHLEGGLEDDMVNQRG